jgi:hypothetical protein
MIHQRSCSIAWSCGEALLGPDMQTHWDRCYNGARFLYTAMKEFEDMSESIGEFTSWHYMNEFVTFRKMCMVPPIP